MPQAPFRILLRILLLGCRGLNPVIAFSTFTWVSWNSRALVTPDVELRSHRLAFLQNTIGGMSVVFLQETHRAQHSIDTLFSGTAAGMMIRDSLGQNAAAGGIVAA